MYIRYFGIGNMNAASGYGRARSLVGLFGAASLAAFLPGCAVLPAAGPSRGAITHAADGAVADSKIKIVDVTSDVAQRLLDANHSPGFDEVFGQGIVPGMIVNRGDTLDIAIWEAPPAVLFGSFAGAQSSEPQRGVTQAQGSALPEQMVSHAGTISVPFVGSVYAAGRTTDDIASDIRSGLQGKAHDPQVIVRLSQNFTSSVTVVGEVSNSIRMPLTAKGERLLDALASAGGVRQPVGKMTIQVTRGAIVSAMPLDSVIRDPAQNVRLRSGDVVTLLFQPYSFTVLGAARANQEIVFEATGLTLSQALGRMGGLDDQRANPQGVFIFRFEDIGTITEAERHEFITTKDGKVPIIYRVNMKNPSTLFVAQSFPIRDKDIIYVSNAPLVDFSKFLQAVSQIVYPIATIQNTNIF
ncbi:polysaccharide export outer membrane protein [Sphingobium sp. B7D2B]|uniref:polysaccharide biosynthesis/export family protein n=1 Tax=Sphingobium sp. B7D2B TaxID=2940583 RepID=UPI0022244795|nr:polysaccharide biosynthesis/export family protein [Sphingobium sp. B7D2B]MCW2366809.1 polysaccharide export outer membrane protein [Sphingobium sp. B7D2B]